MANVDREELRENIRKYVGAPSSSQMSSSEINGEINHFYMDVLPALVFMEEQRATYSFSAADQTEQDLPSTVYKVFPPCTIDDEIAGFYYDATLFWSKHAGASAGTPVDILLLGRTIKLGPSADTNGPYSVEMVSIDTPTELAADATTIVHDRYQDVIELGAALSLLGKQGDDQAANRQNQYLVQYITALQALGAQIDLQAMKDRRSRSNVAAPQPGAGIVAPQQQ